MQIPSHSTKRKFVTIPSNQKSSFFPEQKFPRLPVVISKYLIFYKNGVQSLLSIDAKIIHYTIWFWQVLKTNNHTDRRQNNTIGVY
ncbi:hypothetical protein GDO81_002663 [Engystomops pustulosus]|uniref:Uncharacterized protein n=1 Tax=Engystomops pustulosus TaxID=76066 RepID=A0AAV7DMM3_ENGPU|nr:hypothetical protein GDO81_002663 [Engystomops pustulosus]